MSDEVVLAVTPPVHGENLERFRQKNRFKMRTIWLSLLAIVLAGMVWFGLSAASALSQISSSSDTKSPVLRMIGKAVDPNALAGEGDGRINLLLIGVGGSGHPGGTLADSIMVASLDPQNKKVALLSIPRDLRVPIPGAGTTKINAAHSYGESRKAGDGPKLLKETVSSILDLPIHYFVRVDFQGFVKAIDSLGGITVDVPKPVSDPLYPAKDMLGYEPFYIKAGVQPLSGATALKYARSRETSSDFDRAARQQQILLAVRSKALSAGVLANPKKISDLLGILGSHVRTDLEVGEMQRLVGLIREVDPSAVISTVLDNSADGPLQSVSDGGYYLVPKAGDFSEVRRIAHELFTDPYLVREKARIEIQNATGTSGLAHELELDLRSLGYDIVSVRKADTVAKTTVSDFTSGASPFTARFLGERLKVPIKAMSRPSDGTGVDLRITLGADYTRVVDHDSQ